MKWAEDYLSPAQTRVFLAVYGLRRPTVRGVAAAANRNVSTVHRHLRALRRMGLVTWEHDKQGTLRATVAPVAGYDATPRNAGGLLSEPVS